MVAAPRKPRSIQAVKSGSAHTKAGRAREPEPSLQQLLAKLVAGNGRLTRCWLSLTARRARRGRTHPPRPCRSASFVNDLLWSHCFGVCWLGDREPFERVARCVRHLSSNWRAPTGTRCGAQRHPASTGFSTSAVKQSTTHSSFVGKSFVRRRSSTAPLQRSSRALQESPVTIILCRRALDRQCHLAPDHQCLQLGHPRRSRG